MTDLPVPAQPDNSAMMNFGQTQLDPGDIVMPRVKLLQAQSEEVNAETPLGAAGEFFNTLTSINFGTSFRFVPILPFKQRLLLVRQKNRDGINAQLGELGQVEKDFAGLACRSYDMLEGQGTPGIDCAECPLSKWDGPLPPHCTETYNVAAATEEGELIVISMAKSSARTGKQLFSMIRMRPGSRATLFEITSEKEQGKEGSYFVPRIRPGDSAPPELVRQANQWATVLQGAGPIDVTPDSVVDDADPNEQGGAGKDPF